MSKTFRSVTLSLAVAGASLAPVSASHAESILKDASVHESRPTKIDFLGSVGVGIGVLGWYSMPLVNDGFIPALNDSFNLELGAGVSHHGASFGACGYDYWNLRPAGGVRWDFYLNPRWTVFGTVKAGVSYHAVSNDCAGIDSSNLDGGLRPHVGGGVGAFWNFSEGMGMRFDLGDFGAAVGISINL